MRAVRAVLVTAVLAATGLVGAQAVAQAAPPPAPSTYQKVCENTGISKTRGGEATYPVNAGRNVNVRFIEGGDARINYPTAGWMPASALCAQQGR